MKYTIDSAEKDLDKLVSFGVYSVKSPVHAPSGVTDWANVLVVPTNGSNVYVAQILVTHGGVIYSRGKGGGDWDIWKVLKREPVQPSVSRLRVSSKFEYLQVVENASQGGLDEMQFATATRGFYIQKNGVVELYDRENSKVLFKGRIPNAQPSVSQSPLAGVKRFMMNTGKTKVTFHPDGGHRCFLAFSSGNGSPWLVLYAHNTVSGSFQKLGSVSVEKNGDDECTITAAQWSHVMIIPLIGTVEIAAAQPSVSLRERSVKGKSSDHLIAFEWNSSDSTLFIYADGNKVHKILPNWGAQPSVSQKVGFSAAIESATLSQNVTVGGNEPIMVRIKTDDPSHDYALCVHKSKKIELYDYVSKKSVWSANLTSLCS